MLSHPRAGAGPAQGTSTLRAPLATSSVHYGQDHNQNKPFLAQSSVSTSSTLGCKHLIYLKAKPNLTIQFLGFHPLMEVGEAKLLLCFQRGGAESQNHGIS